MYEEAKESLMLSVLEQIESRGIILEKYCEDHGLENDAFNMNMFMQAAEFLRQNLALDVLAKEKGFVETKQDIDLARKSISSAISTLTDEEFIERGLYKSLAEQIRRDKAMKWLLNNVRFINE